MKTAAIIFTSISISAGILSFAIPAEGVSAPPPIVVQCINWVPTAAVQLAVESLVIDKKPTPTPPDAIVPHPDKDKCPCKGTGTITHGDGHKTECPYHGKDNTPDPDPSKRCRCVTSKTYCNCKKVYGKCRCPTTTSQADKATQKAVDIEALNQQFKSGSTVSGLFRGFKRG
tara:strand:- start:119 stop:634 length:516 start_codon:yes stop_codon:yes gene_type:complete